MLNKEERAHLDDLLQNFLQLTGDHLKELEPILCGDIKYKELVESLFYTAGYSRWVKKEDMPDFTVRSLLHHFRDRLKQPARQKKHEIAYFEHRQRDGIYNYYKVYGGPGKTPEGYQEVIIFLNEKPIITIEYNYTADNGLTGTWCTSPR